MAVMDEFKQQREMIKQGTPKEKFAYFWEYYKWYVIIPLIVILIVGNFIYHKVTDPKSILCGVLLNTGTSADESVQNTTNDFLQFENLDSSDYTVDLNTSLSLVSGENADSANYEVYQALITWIGAGTVDFLTADSDTMITLAYKDYFSDLSQVLGEEEYAFYEPYFLYMDNTVKEAMNSASENDEDTDEIAIPDPKDPSSMENPVPVLIDVSLFETFEGFYDSGDAVLGICGTAPDTEMIIEFLKFIGA